ncbi:MAG: HlyD family efflux transporter periplasmic adaptor subunit [Pseudomonadota bacterium]
MRSVPWGYRIMALVLIVCTSVVAGGVSGLYRQPKPLQIIMEYLGLEAGAGTATPIALPTKPKPASGKDSKSSPVTGTGQTVSSVIALGKLVPSGKVITVAPPSGAGDARLQALKIVEGDVVKAGQVLAVLDNEDKLQATINSAQATISVREADLAKTRSQTRASLAEAQASLANAEAAALSSRLDFERTSTLYSQRVVSKATFDTKRATSEQAEKQVDQAKATLSRYTSTDIDEQSDVVVALKNLESARSDLRRARQDLRQAYVHSPIDGTVLEIHARAGEKPGNDGIMDVGDISNMTVEVEVYQTSIRHVSVGDPVEISSASLPATLTGEVKRIGLQIRKQSVIASDPAASTDARVVEVIVGLDDSSSKTASRFTNLQVEAKIQVGQDK